MELRFNTKEESNLQREKEFLTLLPHERFIRFLKLSRRVLRFKTSEDLESKKEDKNFVIRHPDV